MMEKEKIIVYCDRVIELCFLSLLVFVSFSTSLVEIASSLMIVVWSLKLMLSRKTGFLRSVPMMLLFGYFFWAILSCFNSGYAKESFRGVLKIAEYGLLFIITATSLQGKDIVKKFLYVVLFWSVFICLNGIFQYYSGYDILRHRTLIHDDYLNRISASFGHPNDFGVYLMAMMLILISQLLEKANDIKTRFFVSAAVLLSSVSLYMTKSRGALLSFVAAFLTLGALKHKKILAIFLTILLIVFIMLPYTAQERIFSLTDIKEGTTWERIMLWKGTINMIVEHPFLGFGVNTYSRNFPQYKPAEYPDVRYSHNCYLHMASEIGIVGAFLFILFLVTTLVFCLKGFSAMPESRRKVLAVGVFAALVGFSMNCIVDTHLYSVNLAVFFHILLGFCCAISCRSDVVHE